MLHYVLLVDKVTVGVFWDVTPCRFLRQLQC